MKIGGAFTEFPSGSSTVEAIRVDDRTNRRRHALLGLIVAAGLLTGCTPDVGPDDWSLEPIAFEPEGTGRPDDTFFADRRLADDRTGMVDVGRGLSVVAADDEGGFWATGSASWLHLGADGETLALFDTDPADPLSGIEAMAAVAPEEFVVIRNDPAVLSVLDMTTLTLRDIPGAGFEDFAFADVAVHDGDAILVRTQPVPSAYLDLEVLRVDLDDGSRTLLYRAPLALTDAPAARPGIPPVALDVDAAGRIHLATPSARIVLNRDGSQVSSDPQTANYPKVAVSPDGTALWWGGTAEDSDIRGVIVGGSAAARVSVEQRASCEAVMRPDALRVSTGDAEHPLPFLCGANAAAWTGTSWVAAIGGEDGGVLVRVVPPKSLG